MVDDNGSVSDETSLHSEIGLVWSMECEVLGKDKIAGCASERGGSTVDVSISTTEYSMRGWDIVRFEYFP